MIPFRGQRNGMRAPRASEVAPDVPRLSVHAPHRREVGAVAPFGARDAGGDAAALVGAVDSRPASWSAPNSLTLEAYGGWQNLNINNAATSVANATKGNEGTAIIGGDVLAKLTLFGVGLALDKTVSGNGGQP